MTIKYNGIELEIFDEDLEGTLYNGVDVTELIQALSSPAKNKAGTIITHEQAILNAAENQLTLR